MPQVPPLAPNDPVMLAAAWELARRAAAEQGRQQVRPVWGHLGALVPGRQPGGD